MLWPALFAAVLVQALFFQKLRRLALEQPNCSLLSFGALFKEAPIASIWQDFLRQYLYRLDRRFWSHLCLHRSSSGSIPCRGEVTRTKASLTETWECSWLLRQSGLRKL